MRNTPRPPPGSGSIGAADRAGFMRAVEHHRAGRLAEAEAGYAGFLARHPKFAPALHLYGVLLAQSGRTESGIAHLSRAATADPANAAYHNDLGNALTAAG